MEYQVHIQQVDAQPTAVVRRRATIPELPVVVPQACGEVWAFVRSSNLPNPGRNIALYLDDVMNLECGAEVTQPFVGNDRVVNSNTPAGSVATAAHIGPYRRLPDAHNAIRRWCADHGHALAGPNWEVYAHWDDDAAKLRTDVVYLLRAGDQQAAE